MLNWKTKWRLNWLKFCARGRITSNRYIEQATPSWLPLLLIAPSLLLTLLLLVMPLLFALHSALKVQTGFKYSDYQIGFDNFSKIIGDDNFNTALENTLLLTLISVPLNLILALFIASTIVKFTAPLIRGFWQTLFFLPYVTNAIAISLAFSYLFWPTGLLNSSLGLKLDWLRSGLTAADQQPGSRWSVFFVILVNDLWINQAFSILIFTTALLSVPEQIYRAGRVDGASASRQFFAISLPWIQPQILFLITYQVLHTLKAFPLGLFQNSEVRATTSEGLTLLILLSIYTRRGAFGYAGATTIAIFLISIGFTLITRILIKRLALGYRQVLLKRRVRQVELIKQTLPLNPLIEKTREVGQNQKTDSLFLIKQKQSLVAIFKLAQNLVTPKSLWIKFLYYLSLPLWLPLLTLVYYLKISRKNFRTNKSGRSFKEDYQDSLGGSDA